MLHSLIHSLLLLEEEREEEGARGNKIFSYLIRFHKMPRATGTTEHTARWNSSDDAKFQSLIKRGYIYIDDTTRKFIKSIRTRHG
jgi:hypothetical protein